MESSAISDHMRDSLLDVKSKAVYDRWWTSYCDFCATRNVNRAVFGSFMDYFGHMSELYKVSSLWQSASCINKYLKIFDNTVDFSKDERFKLLMKKLEKKYVPRKSSVFNFDDVHAVIGSTLDLEVQVGMVIGVFGGLRCSEMLALEFEDVIYESGVFKVCVRSSKTDQAGIGHCFYVSPSATKNHCPVGLLKKYIDCFPSVKRTGRFFRMVRNGKGKFELRFHNNLPFSGVCFRLRTSNWKKFNFKIC